MDAMSFGKKVSKYRKQNDLKQAEFADLLNVSNKTVSKWETGRGFPEITQIPMIAKTLNITASDLFEEDRLGITVAGNICIDNLKKIHYFPENNKGTEVITETGVYTEHAGGCVSTVLGNLHIIEKKLKLYAIGRLGMDSKGQLLLSLFQQQRIDVNNVKMTSGVETANTDVFMNVHNKTLKYFYNLCANNFFSADDIDVENINSKILHVGHIMQLVGLFKRDEEYGFEIGRVLAKARSKGIITSVEAVATSNIGQCREMMKCCVENSDYFFIAGEDACTVAGCEYRDEEDALLYKNIEKSLLYFVGMGIKKAVVFIFSNCAFLADSNGKIIFQPSVVIENYQIVNCMGDGGAFVAGFLYSIHENKSLADAMKLATAASARCATQTDAISGMVDIERLSNIAYTYDRYEIKMR